MRPPENGGRMIVYGGNMHKRIEIVQGDITRLECDCIVNAANSTLLGGGGVDGAIHRAAGPELLSECRKLHGCETGQAKITRGFRLPAKYVIHTVGPIYSGMDRDRELLAACYRNALALARENDVHSIAFPAISTGVYGYPKREAASVSYRAICRWLEENADYDLRVILCCFNAQDAHLYRRLQEKCRVLVSSCLLGAYCRYNGEIKCCDEIGALIDAAEIIPICPEIYGGLPTPRLPSERRDGGVFMKDGCDVTVQYARGAREALKIADALGARYAVLKERSPSCGSGEIYDGTFTGTRIFGDGVTAELLKKNDITVYGESRIGELIRKLKMEEIDI